MKDLCLCPALHQPTPVFLPGEFHGHRSLEGYGCKEADMTEVTWHTLLCTISRKSKEKKKEKRGRGRIKRGGGKMRRKSRAEGQRKDGQKTEEPSRNGELGANGIARA